MTDTYNLRSMLGGALPPVGPTRAAVKAMHDVGFEADPKNNDMKELFVGLSLAGDCSSQAVPVAGMTAIRGVGVGSSAGAGESAAVESGIEESYGVERPTNHARPSAARALLDYHRQKKAAQEAAEKEKAVLAGKGVGLEAIGKAVKGVGMARAASFANVEVDEEIARQAWKMKSLSKTAARMSSKQKRRRKVFKAQSKEYVERYSGKVLHKSKRKDRILAMKQMY